MADWDRRFLILADHIARWSKDPSTKVGCVIVGPDREIRATGYNGFPRGVKDDGRLDDRDQKYPLIVHAEENAVMNAARVGVSLKDCTVYVTFHPCTRCARSLVQAGVVKILTWDHDIPERWALDLATARAMLNEAGVASRMVPSFT